MRKPYYLYKRSRSRYYLCQFRNIRTGELEPEVSTGQTNKTLAEAWCQDQLKEIAGSTSLFGDYAATFFGPNCPRCSRLKDEGTPYSPSTMIEYKYQLDRLIMTDKILCAMPLGKIKRGDIIQLRSRWLAYIGHIVSLQKPLDALRAIFAEAAYMEYIEYNPVSKVKNVTYTKRTKNILNAQQIMQLIDPKNFLPKTTGKYKNADTTGFRFCVATALYAFSGMRASEIRALQWKDIDISARRIHIVRAFKSKRHILGPPKSGYARQTVIPEILAPYLSTPSNNPDMWVTGFSTERPMGYKKWHDVFQEVCIEKGTPTTLHALRHALNTMLLEQGVNPELIKAAFGWTSKGNKAEKSFGTNIQENYTHRETYDLTPLAHAIDEIFSKQGAKHGKTVRNKKPV